MGLFASWNSQAENVYRANEEKFTKHNQEFHYQVRLELGVAVGGERGINTEILISQEPDPMPTTLNAEPLHHRIMDTLQSFVSCEEGYVRKTKYFKTLDEAKTQAQKMYTSEISLFKNKYNSPLKNSLRSIFNGAASLVIIVSAIPCAIIMSPWVLYHSKKGNMDGSAVLGLLLAPVFLLSSLGEQITYPSRIKDALKKSPPLAYTDYRENLTHRSMKFSPGSLNSSTS